MASSGTGNKLDQHARIEVRVRVSVLISFFQFFVFNRLWCRCCCKRRRAHCGRIHKAIVRETKPCLGDLKILSVFWTTTCTGDVVDVKKRRCSENDHTPVYKEKNENKL